MPSFPSSTRLLQWLGIDPTLVLPPVPQGEGSLGELPGTDQWCKIVPVESSSSTTVGWFDLQQGKQNDGGDQQQHENFWPGLRRWNLGVRMDDAVIEFPDGKHWSAPRSVL